MTTATPALHPLLLRLTDQHGIPALTAPAFEDWTEQPGDAVVFFSEDPQRYRETLDVAVILPELLHAASRPLRSALLLPEAARTLAARYGVRRWPALVFLRGGAYVGAIEGLRDWAEFVSETEALLAAPTRRLPGIGIAVAAAGPAACHP